MMNNVISLDAVRKARPHEGRVALVAEYGELACVELMMRDVFYYVVVPRCDAAVLFQHLEQSSKPAAVVLEFIRTHPFDEFGVDYEGDEDDLKEGA